ncbi:hypothetical protein BDP81DRAFT_289329, partial [Colletotrichum phormii]
PEATQSQRSRDITSLDEMDQRRKGLFNRTVEELDARHAQRLEDSSNHTWCRPVTRETALEKVKAFHEAMHDDNTLDVDHCKLCYLQRAPTELTDYTWAEAGPLLQQIEDKIPQRDRDHLSCYECFPRNTPTTFPLCSECHTALKKNKLPEACRVNNLALGCGHRYPDELKELSPLEERLIGLYTSSGWITKFTIDIEKWTNGRYRKHKRGHITVVPNNIQGLVAEVLPHPLLQERENIHVCFVGARQPLPSDIAFMLLANPGKLRRALVWLRVNNPLYKNIVISDENLQGWAHHCPGTEVSEALFEQM